MRFFGRISAYQAARAATLATLLLIGMGGVHEAHAQSGVDIEVDQFGLGVCRPGGVVPLRLKLTSNLNEPMGVWVQWQVPNADGDIGEYGRSLTLSPGQSAFTWLYAPLQPNDNVSTVYTVRVFEEQDGERGGELGGRRISPADAQAQMADLRAGIIAVIGDRRMGLEDFGMQTNFRLPRPISGHEDTRIASGLKPSELPDRWYGLTAFEAIAWVGDNTPPLDLSIDQADALREYVSRGGHLVISLPAAGNPWGLGAAGQTQLEDILPCRRNGVAPRRDEAVPLSQLLSVMSKTQNVRALIGNRTEPQVSLRVFRDLKESFNVIDNGYEPLLALQDGRVVAVQRRVGFGRVTVLGIDLSDGRLASVGLPHADVLWNRILGRRADTPTIAELTETEKAEWLARAFNETDRNMGSGALFAGAIAMQGTAGAGLLLAFLLFIAYWIVALFSFFLLKQYRLARHAWLAFACIAGLFTVVAWGSVGLIPKSVPVQHVTILDHVARTADASSDEAQYQRAISYLSVFLPRYGLTDVELESSDEMSAPGVRNLLTFWTPPGEGITPFPNTDTFRVDVARRFDGYPVPSRSTSTHFYANWIGGVSAGWGGLLRFDPRNPVRVVKNPGGSERAMAGTIINELPGTLKDVRIFWIRSARTRDRAYARAMVNEQEVERPWISPGDSGMMLATGEMYSIADPGWLPGSALDLATLEGKGAPLTTALTSRYIQPFINSSGVGAPEVQSLGPADRRRFMEMLSIFHQLRPPEYLRDPRSNDDPSNATFHRELGRELDLSAWFVRPCLIVTGFLEDVALPIPVRVGEEEVSPDSKGLVMVRWICPIPVDEAIAFRLGDDIEEPVQESDAD